jgi:uncharacterized RDD family membrane protein YckC
MQQGYDFREMHPWPLLQPARRWSRLMSAVVDLGLLCCVWVLTGVLVGLCIGALYESSDLLTLFLQDLKMFVGALFIWIFLPCLAGWGYYTLLRAACGHTLGELLWGLRVVREDGTPINLGDVLLRGIWAIFSLIPMGAGYWWSLLNRQSRTWHGLMSGTRVVETWPAFFT